MIDQIFARISRFRNRMQVLNVDTFIVLSQENRQYLSGFTGQDTQFDESAGSLIISHDAQILATDSRYELQARAEATQYEVICLKKGLATELPTILNQLKSRRIGFESRRLSYDQCFKIKKELETQQTSIELIPLPECADELRLIKDDTEIFAIREAVKLAESAFEKTISIMKDGMTEIDAAWELEKNMRVAGAQAVSFPVIAAFGKNGALPHAIPGTTILNNHEPILIDWGARLNGYCSDTTRCLVLGKPDFQFQKIFTIVSDAQKKAIDAIRPGIRTKQIDDIARNHIAEKGLKEFFGHGLGHGVGLAIHELPSISPIAEKDTEIQENMVFTIEPGIYLPDWGGIRIENMILVKKDGAEILNHLETNIMR